MSKYEIQITDKVKKSLTSINNEDRLRIQMTIDLLGENPRPPATKKLQDSNYYRVRVGDYRIIYSIDDGQLIIQIIQAIHRREAYRNL